MNTEIHIDAVYTWVDMNDKKWLQKYKNTIGRYPESTRYMNYGELEFSVKLLIKHCSFIRNIYIVTDEQIPSWYDKEKYSNIFIIDHSEILGKDCHKPTFKSDAIESYLHEIPGLSEYYIYFNDDTFVGNNCSIFNFIDKKTLLPIARFKSATLNDNMKRLAIQGKVYSRAINLTNAMNCVKKVYKKHYNKIPIHQAVILRKSMGELAWKLFPNELAKSVKNPIRKPQNDTISFTNLSMLLGLATNKMKHETDRYSIRIYNNYSLANDGANYTFIKLLHVRPQLFCINDVNDLNYRPFRQFMIKYLQN